jgi:hypothetical protein
VAVVSVVSPVLLRAVAVLWVVSTVAVVRVVSTVSVITAAVSAALAGSAPRARVSVGPRL